MSNMQCVDIIFGRRIEGSYYHINTTYFKRYPCESEFGMIDAVLDSITRIANSNEYTDTVFDIINNIRDGLMTIKNEKFADVDTVNKLNISFAELSFKGYELLAIGRNDAVADGNEISMEDRTYLMNKRVFNDNLLGINNFQLGIGMIFDNGSDANLTSMLMEFISSNKLTIGTTEDSQILNLQMTIDEYNSMMERGESAHMDTTKLLHMLEQLNYRFVLTFNVTSSNIDEE